MSMFKTHLVFVIIIIIGLMGIRQNQIDGMEPTIPVLLWFVPIGLAWYYFIRRSKKKEKIGEKKEA